MSARFCSTACSCACHDPCECCDYGDEYAECTCCYQPLGCKCWREVAPPFHQENLAPAPPETITLEKQKVASFTMRHPQVSADMKYEESDSVSAFFMRGYVLERLETFIYGNSIGRIEYSFPATWWDHFKRDTLNRFALGRWYVRRHPVRLAWDVKSARTMFPQNQILPKELGPLVFSVDDDLVATRARNEWEGSE